MNLINDVWLPVIRASGKNDKIAPWQIVESTDPVIELNAPRPDFQGALYQFLIGLLQTCFAPADHDGWMTYWADQPNETLLQSKFATFAAAFNLECGDELPAFMQDYDNFDGENLPVEDLVGGAISDNTREKNQDLFTKRNHIRQISPYWAAIALFNMQTTGVLAWGKHRVGMRGNGPLTTLIMPSHGPSNLWKKLWLNVLSEEEFISIPGNRDNGEMECIFPWLAKTRISPNKEPTSPENGHPLQVYWPMPRRIRLVVEKSDAVCDICGEQTETCVRFYKRIKDGIYYRDGWKHPLTPYTRKDRQNFPVPVLGSKISFDYRDWSPLTINGYVDDMECSRALIVSVFQTERSSVISDRGQLWCFGYDADSAKVIRWYEARFPLLCTSQTMEENIRAWSRDMIEAAKIHVIALKHALIRAWFNPRIDRTGKETWSHVVNKKGETPQGQLSSLHFVEENFWSETETFFYQMLSEVTNVAAQRNRPLEIYKKWMEYIRHYSIHTFEAEAFSFVTAERNIKRAVSAKKYLFSELWPQKGLLAELNALIKTL